MSNELTGTLSPEQGLHARLAYDAEVISVNDKTGVVSLTTTDIPEGDNKYFTKQRFDTSFGGKSSADLEDGDTIMHSNEVLTLECGGASDVND